MGQRQVTQHTYTVAVLDRNGRPELHLPPVHDEPEEALAHFREAVPQFAPQELAIVHTLIEIIDEAELQLDANLKKA